MRIVFVALAALVLISSTVDAAPLSLPRMKGRRPTMNAYGFSGRSSWNVFGMTRNFTGASLFSGSRNSVGLPSRRSRYPSDNGYRQLGRDQILRLEDRMYAAPDDARDSGYRF